jgi:hypothetical protein
MTRPRCYSIFVCVALFAGNDDLFAKAELKEAPHFAQTDPGVGPWRFRDRLNDRERPPATPHRIDLGAGSGRVMVGGIGSSGLSLGKGRVPHEVSPLFRRAGRCGMWFRRRSSWRN